MSKFIRNEIIVLTFLIFIGLLVRSLHFAEYLNFSSDQARDSIKAIEIWKTKEIVLIGPPITSFRFEGREIFYGPLTYYIHLFFLVIGNFDPIKSTYLFTLVGVLMVVPLYVGVSKLVNRQVAIFISSIYILLPFYINYSRFLWNPNFQFILTPLVIYLMGIFHKKKKLSYIFLISVLLGALFQLHYQYFFVIIGLGIYYFLICKPSLKSALIFGFGFGLGLSPLILFELRNNFYNTRTMLLFIQNLNTVLGKGIPESFNLHYILSLSLFTLLIIGNYVKSVFSYRLNIISFVSLLILSLFLYMNNPSHGFGMVEYWKYEDEVKVNNIIESQQLKRFNVVNLRNDTRATAQKYFLIRDGFKINYEDYQYNKYLFVISNRSDYMSDPAYEINTFKPSKVAKKWKINSSYNLYLLERIETT